MQAKGLTLAVAPAVTPFVLGLGWISRRRHREALVEALLTSELARLSPATARSLLRTVRADGSPAEAALSCREGLTAKECTSLDALCATLADAEAVASRSVGDAFRVLWTSLAYARRLV